MQREQLERVRMDGITEDVLALGGDQMLSNKISTHTLSTQKGCVGTLPGDPTVVAAVVTCLSHNGPSSEDAMAVALHRMRLKKGLRKNLHEGDVYKALRSMVRSKVNAMIVCDRTDGPGDPFVYRLTAVGEAAAAALDRAGDAMIGHDWTGGTGDPYVWSLPGPAAAAL
ncbi:hypothetical protein FOA52_005878 [Chlamydomonas sp. UWO 241]|nr:hypothetical protein FOA52_005878 [Chlamydomonas sp. UWO 241]